MSKTKKEVQERGLQILELLNREGQMKPEEISNHFKWSVRSVRYALHFLINDKRVYRRPDFHDLRTFYYATTPYNIQVATA